MSTVDEPRVFDEATLKAMRDATRLVFRHDQSEEVGKRGLIACIKEVEEGVWGKTERRIDFQVNSRAYSPSDLREATRCYAHLYGYDPTVKGALAFLKPTDLVSLKWIENSNGYVQNAGLAMDMLLLVVRRQVRKDIQTYEFMLDVTVSERDAYARMIRI